MANDRRYGPRSLYGALMAAKYVRVLNATTRPTNREELLEILLFATLLEANNGSLRYPRRLFDQADDERAAGRRLDFAFDEVAHEYVVTLTAPTEPGQQQIPVP